MKILMIVPQPFFQSRGTPFSVYYRTRTLAEMGHKIDIITYPIGRDVRIPGVRILRSLRLPRNDVDCWRALRTTEQAGMSS